MATNPNDKGQPLNPSEGSGPSGPGGLSDDDRAGAGMEIGRMLSQIDAQEKADPFPFDVDVPKSVPPDLKSDYTYGAYDDQYYRSQRRRANRTYLIAILIFLGSAAIAGALLFWRVGGEDTTPTSGGVAAPAGQPAPAADAAQAPAAGPDAIQSRRSVPYPRRRSRSPTLMSEVTRV